MKISNYFLEIAIFICGAVVMVYELVGSRILGPYFGTSIFVWAGLIGIILGSLSLGYYLGGKISDKNPNLKMLAFVILLAAAFIGLTFFIKDGLLNFLQISIPDIRLASVVASLVLFLPTSFLLGMVSPYAAKLKLVSLNNSGATIGNLYAISTAGSIFGTFLSGFYLIPHFGTNKLLIILSVTLAVVALVLPLKNLFKTRLTAFFIVMALGLILLGGINARAMQSSFIDVDTAYNRIWIYDRLDSASNRMVKEMGINNENHSSMFLDSEELANKYTEYYNLAQHFKPDFKKTLMLGGAGYSFPKYFLTNYPEATMDVVEIDPKVTDLARQYFRLRADPRLTIYHEDGRVYLNNTKEKYDVIFGDAFTSHHSVPYQLTTLEAIQNKYDSLNDGGVVILNLISAIEGDKGQFLRAEYATYVKIFPQVYLFPVNVPVAGGAVQNIILIALKSDQTPAFTSADVKLNEYLKHRWLQPIENDMPILTDDFAPVDNYIGQAI